MATIRKLKFKSGEVYQLDYRDHLGNRKKKNLHVDLKTADRIRKEVELRIERIKLGLEIPPLDSPYLKPFIMEYLKYKESIVSDATVKRDKFALRRFLEFYGNKRISQVTAKKIDEYVVQMHKELSDATVGIELRHLKAALNTAKRWEYITSNPLNGYKIPDGVPKIIRVLTLDEISLLFSVIDDLEMKDIISVYLSTGARRAELLKPNFRWDNVDFKNTKIRFDGKGGISRYVPMTPTVVKLLLDRLTEGTKFPFKYGQDHVSHRLRDYYRTAGIENANLHTLRKTFGSLLIQEGYADIYIVSKLLGHSSVKVTERHYIHLLDENYQSSVNGLDEILNRL